ncbi:MAG: bifunctional protein-serine/threonine kinase/phosphatase [Rhodoferax sp.]|nr:bifunctional protein-serine/threonine kinase/phosphatase [Rhodoferax sp.]
MANDALQISAGQHSDKGRKDSNQDFHGLVVPKEPQLSSKGIALALADGISSSAVSHIAAQAAVTSFLEDYYCTSEAWSVKTSAERILSATNAWLHAQTQHSPHRYDMDKGYVCTLSALVLKSTTAHLFHVGDSRIYRLRGSTLEQLTNDHRVWVANGQSYLGRALGITPQLELDYQALALEVGDIFILATDGVYEPLAGHVLTALLQTHAADLEQAARALADAALAAGSADNLTVQIVRIDALPQQAMNEMVRELSGLPFPPLLEPRADFDGFTILRELKASFRSHVYLAVDRDTGTRVVIKTPSIDLQTDPAYVERFLTEEWVARRIDSAHVLKPCLQTRKRHFIYVVTEFIDGQTLAQWMIDNPKPTLEAVRGLVEQIGKGLQAFHRLEMLHQDLRPDNVMIDGNGTAKIIDFGSTRVAGLTEAAPLPGGDFEVLGTVQYAAPEYFLGESGSTRSDIFSLGVLTYHLLTGRLPYGATVARTRTRAAQAKLQYDSVLDDERDIPAWIDGVLRKAVHTNPAKRYAELSEFLYDLRHPNQEFLSRTKPPLIERNPLVFWKSVSALLAVTVIVLLAVVSRHS